MEDAPFLSLILKTSVKYFRQAPGKSLIRDFSGDHNKQFLKFIVHFFTVFKDCSVVRSYFETNVLLGNYKQVWNSRARQIGLEANANLYALMYSLTCNSFHFHP